MAVELNDNALLTTTELKEFLQWTSTDSDYMNTLINFASDFIERYCNRKFKAADYISEVYDGNGETELYLKNAPINSVTTIANWDSYNNKSSYEYTEHTEYMIYGEEGYIYLRSKWVSGRRNFQITYNGGFETIPYDLRKACADLCSLMKNHGDKAGLQSEKIGNYSYSLGAGSSVTIGGLAIPAETLSILVNYRIINI